MKTCERCGKQFEPKDDRPNRPARFCSRECGRTARRSRVVLTCRQCGCSFERKAYMADWSKSRGPFCGFRCYGEWQRLHTHGEANPNFRPESPRRGSGQWQRNRRAALERDGHRCQRCGAPNRLHVHHRQNWSPDDPTTHGLDNLETVCASCHRRLHPQKRGPDGKLVPNR